MGEDCHRGSPDLWQQHRHPNPCSHNTLAPSPNLVGVLSSTHPTPQPCTRSGMTTARERMLLWAVPTWSHRYLHRWHISPQWAHEPTCFKNHLFWGMACTQRKWRLGDFYSNNWGAGHSTPWQGDHSYKGEGKPPPHTLHRLWIPRHQTHLLQGENVHHTLRKDVVGVHIKKNSHTKDIRHTQCTQGCSHIKTLLQDHSK